jgi:hypothetical protein
MFFMTIDANTSIPGIGGSRRRLKMEVTRSAYLMYERQMRSYLFIRDCIVVLIRSEGLLGGLVHSNFGDREHRRDWRSWESDLSEILFDDETRKSSGLCIELVIYQNGNFGTQPGSQDIVGQ